jgi:hypothetical protein
MNVYRSSEHTECGDEMVACLASLFPAMHLFHVFGRLHFELLPTVVQMFGQQLVADRPSQRQPRQAK